VSYGFFCRHFLFIWALVLIWYLSCISNYSLSLLNYSFFFGGGERGCWLDYDARVLRLWFLAVGQFLWLGIGFECFDFRRTGHLSFKSWWSLGSENIVIKCVPLSTATALRFWVPQKFQILPPFGASLLVFTLDVYYELLAWNLCKGLSVTIPIEPTYVKWVNCSCDS